MLSCQSRSLIVRSDRIGGPEGDDGRWPGSFQVDLAFTATRHWPLCPE